MIRIVGIQRSHRPQEEFILLQNQGGMRVSLRNHLLIADSANGDPDCGSLFRFGEEALIPSGAYVILRSGFGDPRWARTKDGALIYYAFAGREERLWPEDCGKVHVFVAQHTWAERALELALS